MNPVAAPSNVFVAAVQWLQGALLGSVAMIIGVLAVASVGMLLMSGRVDMRRAARVIFGCFILFGASSIATEITAAFSGQTGLSPTIPAALPTPVNANEQVSHPLMQAAPADPYAGAALPAR